MNSQVLSIEQMQELNELDIDTSNASMYYYLEFTGEPWGVLPKNCPIHPKLGKIPTFTIQDVMEMLPDDIIENDEYHPTLINDGGCFILKYMANDGTNHPEYPTFTSYDCIETAFNMVKWCKENNII